MTQNPFLFYSLMDYPLPRQKDFFAYDKKNELWGTGYAEPPTRSNISEQMKEYSEFVKKRQWIRKCIPFLEAVYIGNSMAFNGLSEESDIDIFLIANVGRLRHVRFWSVLVTYLLGIKRTKNKVRKKFCLSFCVATDHADLQAIKLVPHDPYLIYWVAHLVPIYQQFEEYSFNIYEQNKWIQYYLPNHPLQQVVFLDIAIEYGTKKMRRVLEGISKGRGGEIIEYCIRSLRLPIILWKRKKLGYIGKQTIVSDHMLKFHHDKRKAYALKWKLARQKYDKEHHKK